MHSNVRSIDALIDLRASISRLMAELDLVVQDIGGCTQAAQQWVHVERPAYWKQQTALAERRLSEALEQLSQARSTVDPRNRPPASEAQQRVARARQRLRLCQEKRVACRRQAAELEAVVLRVAGPLASVGEHAEKGLPLARAELAELVRILHRYTEQTPAAASSPTADPVSRDDALGDTAAERPAQEGPAEEGPAQEGPAAGETATGKAEPGMPPTDMTAHQSNRSAALPDAPPGARSGDPPRDRSEASQRVSDRSEGRRP